MKHGWHDVSRLGFGAWLGTCLLLLLPCPLAPRAAASDALGLDAAVAEVRAALEDMADALNGGPRQVQTTISADLHLTSHSIARALDRLEGGVPIPDPTLAYDLNLLADIAKAATEELHAMAVEPAADLDPQRGQRIDRLTEAAAARLAEVNLVIESWNERSRETMVDVQDDDGVLLIRSTDRLVYNGVRYVSIALLLVGLLALGLHLLHASDRRVAIGGPRRRKAPWLTALGSVALVGFFASCLAFSLRPESLAALSAEVEVQAQEHPCERLAAQRVRLIAAQQTDHAGLIAATERRMRPAARDCLGLRSEAMTAEALERLAAKAALVHEEPGWAGEAAPGGLSAAGAGGGDRGVASAPQVAELRPAETQASGGLAELLANLRDAERPIVDPPGPAVGPARSASEAAEPAVEPIEPAAGPDQTAALGTAAEPGSPEDPPEFKPATFVTTTTLNYREGPSADARRLGTLVPGARLRVVGRGAGWAQVRLGDGRQVYVATEFLVPAR